MQGGMCFTKYFTKGSEACIMGGQPYRKTRKKRSPRWIGSLNNAICVYGIGLVWSPTDPNSAVIIFANLRDPGRHGDQDYGLLGKTHEVYIIEANSFLVPYLCESILYEVGIVTLS
jgi:hypothetical protein